MTSPVRRAEILDALRRGTVPRHGLDTLAVGLDDLGPALDQELDRAARGGAVFKAVRGEYGSGKTFLSRWLADRARKRGLATSEAQISETETPLHRLETVYRRLMERLSTATFPERGAEAKGPGGAWRAVVDGWLFTLEEDVLAEGVVAEDDAVGLAARTAELLEQRLAGIGRTSPSFAAALRGYHRALARGESAVAEGLLAWLAGQPNVAASIKRAAGVKGDVDHFGALTFLQGLLTLLRDSGYGGLLLVLDELETLQRVRGDVREKSLNALRQWVDEIDGGRFPGLYLLITGTPAFFDGPQGVARLPPLAQRLAVDFRIEARFDNPRAAQIRLPGFDLERLQEVGRRVRELFVEHLAAADGAAERLAARADDTVLAELAHGVVGELGGKVGVAPRVFLKKWVDLLDRVEQHPDFEPRRHYTLHLADHELGAVERAARGVDDIELEL